MRTFIFIFALAIQIPIMVSAQVLTDSLIFLYNFSGSAADSSGNDLHGSVNGATLITDRFGNENAAFYLDGVNDYIEIPYSPLVQVDYPVSFSLYVIGESLLQSNGRFFNTEFTPSDYTGFNMGIGPGMDGVLALGYGCGLGVTNPTNRRTKFSGQSMSLNEWHHVAGVIRGPTDMDIYIDCLNSGGYYDGSGPSAVAHAVGLGRIGAGPPNQVNPANYFLGAVDQFAMWNRALTLSDISKICDGHLEPFLVSTNVEKKELEVIVRYRSGSDNIEIISHRILGEEVKVELLTLTGQSISAQKIHDQQSVLSVAGLSNGIYLVRIQSETNQFVKKISIVR